MYIVAKVEIQTLFAKKNENDKVLVLVLKYTCLEFLSSNALALTICHFCMNFSRMNMHLNFCNKVNL